MSASSAAEQQQYLRHLPRLQNSVSSHLPTAAFLAIDVDITFHYVTSQFSAFSSALVGSALLGVARRYRCSQISTFTDLSVARSIARRTSAASSQHFRSISEAPKW